ncbi:MAG TPA: hypothetical protein VKZ18_12995 [Polyangia bacterium]|nr:hypothetical protein [Polyangia bacterium]
MIAVRPRLDPRLAVALIGVGALAWTGGGCSGAPLGGGTGGDRGITGAGCTPSGSCLATGGSVGAGGITAAGGATGTAGAGGAFCADLENHYTIAFGQALACTPGAPGQCQALALTTPTVCAACGIQQPVNDATALDALQSEWLQSCATSIPCVDLGCSFPPGVCVPNGPGATTGTCMFGSSDAGVDGGETCDQLAADYQAALTASLVCTPGAANQCQASADPMLSACNTGCDTLISVNDASAVNDARMRWAARCATDIACPLIVCQPTAVVGTCTPGGPSGVATCVTGAPVTTN